MSDFGTVVPSQVPTNIAAFVWKDAIFEGGFFFLPHHLEASVFALEFAQRRDYFCI